MRTTLILDDDVRAKLLEEMRRSGRPFKQVVNEFLRLGLNARCEMEPLRKCTVRTRPLGLPPELSYDNVEELLDQLDGLLRS